MREMFNYLIETGVESLEAIGNPKDKVLACAELAKAIAQFNSTIITGVETLESIPLSSEDKKEEVKETKKKSTKGKSKGKKALEPEASKEEQIVEEAPEIPQAPEEEKEEVLQEPTEPTEPTDELDDEWTDRMTELKQEQMESLQWYVENWGEEYVYGIALKEFSQGEFDTPENIRPTNIDAFVAYLYSLYESQQEQ